MKKYIRLVLLALPLFAACVSIEPNDSPGQQPVVPGPGQEEELDPDAKASVYGKVLCGDVPLPGVVVSDGVLVTATDEKGEYTLDSEKKYGYVFISVPSGYDVPVLHSQPQFFKRTSKGQKQRIDFNLSKADQNEYVMLFFGDMHLANRLSGSDLRQFRSFCQEVNSFAQGRRIYAMTLGDMSWNTFWYKYDLCDYSDEISRSMLSDLRIFPTIGNHDHSNDTSLSDFDKENEYRSKIGPNYYSFNIGRVHYVSLDNILWPENSSGITNAVNSEEMAWLRKDLSYVDKNAPLVITMHAPLYYEGGKLAVNNGSAFFSALDGFRDVKVVTGHTHIVYTTDKLKSGVPVLEANSGAVCGGWWMTGSNGYENLCPDGAPSGYRIMNVHGSAYDWVYKATGRDLNYQFRSYDRNRICFTPEKYTPNATENGKLEWAQTASDYQSASSDNYVILNIWGYDPDWKINVTENGRLLEWTRLYDKKDPLYLVCYEAYEYEHHYDNSVYYPSYTMDHLFRVKASAPNTTLEISVTDRFGNTYTERMTRPKEFVY